jgi:S-adenosylmethionine-dependent methyltransferase
MKLLHDQNFDALIDAFAQRVYDTAKGQWRLKLLQEDLLPLAQTASPLAIWDAGCGFGQISLWLAQHGHALTLCDVSEKMLQHAQQAFAAAEIEALFYQQAAQTLASQLPSFDVVLFHAVLEWLVQPLETLATVATQVKPGGYLSLLFYNRNAMVYLNTLKGSWRWKNLLTDCYMGKGSKLTPPNPQFPHEVIAQLQALGFTLTRQTGIRVFHDYVSKEILRQSDLDELFALEYRYCRQPTYRDMGRYIHLLARRTDEVMG